MVICLKGALSRYVNWRWQRSQRIRKFTQAMQALYALQQGAVISLQARQRRQLQSTEFVYGEIETLSFAALLQRLPIAPGSVFYDLGSGTGKAVVAAAMLYPKINSVGIEIIPELQIASLRVSSKLPEQQRQRIQFICADIKQYPFYEDADIVFMNATGFFAQSWQAMVGLLAKTRRGTRIIVSSKRLPPSHFKLLYQADICMSWGFCGVRIYEKYV